VSVDAVAVKATVLSYVVESVAITVKSLQVAMKEVVQGDQTDTCETREFDSKPHTQTVERIMETRLK